MGKGGRPSFLDDESKAGKQRVKKLLRLMERAVPLRDACRASGISLSAVMRAMREGAAAEKRRTLTPEQERYRQFRQRVLEARGKAKAVLIERWHNATAKNWRAAQAMLRALFPEEFAPDLFIAKRVVDDDGEDERALPGIRVRRQTRDEAEAQRQKKSDVDAGDEE